MGDRGLATTTAYAPAPTTSAQACNPNAISLRPTANDAAGATVAKIKTPDLIRYVNGVLERIRADGTWESIDHKWLRPALGDAQPPPAQYAG